MIYLDTNVFVSLLIEDRLSESAAAWFSAQDEPLAVSEWLRAEFNAVIGLRKRKDELSAHDARAAAAKLDAKAEQHFAMLPVTNEAAVLAASWLRNPDCNLQTGDALHLAISHKGGATTLATFDDRFAKAAKKLKLYNLKIVLIPERSHKAEQKRAAYKIDRAVRVKPIARLPSRKKSR
jgi:predicted nucleic acid-binding protein